MDCDPGAEAVIVPEPLIAFVDNSCAKAVVSAIALTTPAANNLINLFCLIFVLCFG
jgi:hypothetical protein